MKSCAFDLFEPSAHTAGDCGRGEARRRTDVERSGSKGSSVSLMADCDAKYSPQN